MDGIQVIRFPYFFPKKYQQLAYHGGILPSIKKGVIPKIQIPFLFLSEFFHAILLSAACGFACSAVLVSVDRDASEVSSSERRRGRG